MTKSTGSSVNSVEQMPTTSSNRRRAVVTGASTGIGKATALRLADEGFIVYAAARRLDLLKEIAKPDVIIPVKVDITDEKSVEKLHQTVTEQGEALNVLVNNAGGAFGLGDIASESIAQWQKMYDLNVIGTLRMVQTLLPTILASGHGDIVNVTSIAAYDVYRGGVGYNAAKFAQRVLNEGLREELLGQPVRVTEVIPGAVHTQEFSLNRFDGDEQRADTVYQGFRPLDPEDIADAIAWAVTRKPHINIDKIQILPSAQLDGRTILRKPST